MGFFDTLMNLNPEQSSALLNFGSGLLQSGGPSLQPIGFGQALGGAMQQAQKAMTEAEQRKLMRQAHEQQYKLNGVKLRDAESDFANQERQRQEAAQVQKVLSQLGTQATMQAAMGGNFSPTIENAIKMQQAGAQSQDEYSTLMAQAQALRAAGLHTAALQKALEALKFQPEFDQTPRVGKGADGKAFTYVLDKRGNKKVLEGVMPRDEMKLANLGGTEQAYNPYELTPGQSFTKTQTPGEVASNGLGYARLNFDKQQANKPIFNAEAGGFVLPPSQQNPKGGFIQPDALAARGPKLTEDQGKATGWLVQAENAFKNMMAVGRDSKGKPTPAARPGFNDALAAVPSFGATEGVANMLRSEDRQKFMQASSSLSEALLRAATGAGINKDEASQKVREITPQVGDSDAVIGQKYAAIPLYIESLKVRAGNGAPQAARVLDGSKPQSRIFSLDGGGSATGTLGADGNYYVTRGGKRYRVEEN